MATFVLIHGERTGDRSAGTGWGTAAAATPASDRERG